MSNITKAVIPAAGLGTRFLPATKALPKEMLPVVDKPAIQYVVEEAVGAGLAHVLMITGRHKNALENHFDRAVELENLLIEKGDNDRLGVVAEATGLADLHYVRQGDPLGLGHAISKAETFVGNEPFAVLLGDDLIEANGTLLTDMIEIAQNTQANVVALMEVPESDVHKYGIIRPANRHDNVVEVSELVEKPSAEAAPSNFAVIGRYVLQPGVFEVLRNLKPGLGGEYQLTDALNEMAAHPELAGPVIGLVFEGRRFDTGDRLSYLKTIVELASEREDLGSEFTDWLKDFTSKQ
ncbi:UTP--glucose-1-phosphate uridylyltransferase GalU [Aurantimicrobium sp. MWH-Uga1]|uniref:UTP--glucose-1-phosphate uridylyltransferase GalU n=1 Tax=Aurantimicrobium sp. MWH-Uga1 TaxID=2079575 RepID=UPI000DED6E69|nr:UTP--glucose-1-phosphate uridylyltransferase GalU [Aurantimicrobium sp. MWH-Uga1]AXE54935.1 UTP--glucose-1-phosphate uridylyltransferase [Aurantimicrobium sp. MWH-Uga1]